MVGAVGEHPLGLGAGAEVKSRVPPGPAQPATIGISTGESNGSTGTSLLRAEGP